MAGERPISSLLLAELYEAEDDSFVNRLQSYQGEFRPILGLIEKWKKDQRKWALRMKIDFVLYRKWTPQGRVIFKRLFKQAWAANDRELMIAFLVSLDGSIRRKRQTRYRFEPGIIETYEVLRVPRKRPQTGFSLLTLHYLRRRAWRFFRRVGHEDSTGYLSAIGAALVCYSDSDMETGENLLDCWGFMHACFGKSPLLKFNARHTNLTADGRLVDLKATPMFERHWATADGMRELIKVLLEALCRPSRVWAIQLLRRLHAESLPKIDAGSLLRLIDHADPDVAVFAAELLGNAQAVASFPMSTWLALLGTRNVSLLPTICQAFIKHVSFDRLTLAQAVELAGRSAGSVAKLGLDVLRGRTIGGDADLAEIANLAFPRSGILGGEIAAFALALLNVPGVYQIDRVVGFFDSNVKTIRQSAFSTLAAASPAAMDPAFWARLFESPYDDVRIELVQQLDRRRHLPGASAEPRAMLWQSVLLNIHRGGRSKLSALRQISDYIIRDPNSAAALLPVLAVAIRSVRPPEARHGLAAVVEAVEHLPGLSAEVSRYLPELQLDAIGAGGSR